MTQTICPYCVFPCSPQENKASRMIWFSAKHRFSMNQTWDITLWKEYIILSWSPRLESVVSFFIQLIKHYYWTLVIKSLKMRQGIHRTLTKATFSVQNDLAEGKLTRNYCTLPKRYFILLSTLAQWIRKFATYNSGCSRHFQIQQHNIFSPI